MFKKKVTIPVAVLVLLILLVVAFLVRWAGDSITWQRSLSKSTISTMGGLAMEIPEGVDVLEYVRANGADFRNSTLFDSPEYVSLSYSNGFWDIHLSYDSQGLRDVSVYDNETDMYTFAATDHAWRIYNFRYGVNLFPLNTV